MNEPRSVNKQCPMNGVTSAPMRTTLITALLCTASLLLPCAHAQQGEADTKQLTILRTQAEKGDAKAQFELAKAFYAGKYSVATNYVEAVKWFRKAAGQNDALAQSNLGACYANGQGVARDEVEAVRWYRKAAEQNHPAAQSNLGNCYDMGQGLVKDEVEAVKWFRKAAEQNLPAAQSNLGVCYEHGDGVAKHEVEAYKWDLLAAAQGDAKAKLHASMLELMMSQKQIMEGKQRANGWLEQRKKPSTNSR